MSHFVDTNQQRVCTECGNRWYSAHVDSACQKCATRTKLGGQILPAEPAPKEAPKAAASKKKKAKSDED